MTEIQWTDRTFNPLTGCTKISPGCANCYAEKASGSGRLQQFEKYQGIVDSKGQWTGEVHFHPEVLAQIRRIRKPCKIFMPSMSDPFHESVKDQWLDQIWATMALTPHITYQILTKRPQRMIDYCNSYTREQIQRAIPDDQKPFYCLPDSVTCLPNVWLGVSVENQKTADERIPLLLEAPGAVRFLSCEPLLGEVDINAAMYPDPSSNSAFGFTNGFGYEACLNWVIVGGESGSNARPCYLEWIRSIVQQCKDADVPVFIKQLGADPVGVGCEATAIIGHSKSPNERAFHGSFTRLNSPKGSDPSEWPSDLRIREFPR